MADVVPITREQRRSRRKRPVRAKTESVKRMPKRHLRLLSTLADIDLAAAGDFFSPTTRGDCARVPRPCPHVSCVHHLYLDVSAKTGAIKLNFPDLEPDQLPPEWSCALDVADRGGGTLEDVGEFTNLTRERVRQIEITGLRRLAELPEAAVLREYLSERGGGPPMNRAGTEGSLVRAAANAREIEQQPVEEEPDEELAAARAANARLLEAARFGSLVGHFMTAFRMPLREAWVRAIEYVEEFPGELPEGCELVMPKKRTGGPWWLGSLATPPERRTEPPKSVEHMVPRESAGAPDLLDPEAPLLLEGEEPKPAQLAPSRRPKTSRPEGRSPDDGHTREKGPAPAGGAKPAFVSPRRSHMFQDDLIAAVEKNPESTSSEIATALGKDSAYVSTELKKALEKGLVDRLGVKGAYRWKVGSGKVSDEPVPEKKPAEKKPAKKKTPTRAKTNGHAAPPPASPASSSGDPVAAALLALRDALTNKHAQQMSAIETLLKG